MRRYSKIAITASETTRNIGRRIAMTGLLLSPIALCHAAEAGNAIMQTDTIMAEALPEAEYISDGRIYIQPLFDYPIAPEELPDLQSKSDYLMKHFWDAMDFSQDKAVDQAALNDAFRAYIGPALFASRDEVLNSIAELTKKIKGHPIQTLQFAKAAEESLYGKRAEFWSDEAYMPFLKAVVADKKVPDNRRKRYVEQLSKLERNAVGKKFPKVRLTLRNGRHFEYQPSAEYAIIEFASPDCEDCAFANTKLTMAGDLEEWIDNKEVEVAVIVPDAVPEDQPAILEKFKEYPEKWIAGIAYGADETFDIRLAPDFYIVGPGGKIAGKNMNATDVVNKLRELKNKTK